MNSVKNDLKIYQFIQTESLPVQVMSHLEKYFIPDEMPVVITELLKSLGEICERGFQVIDLTAEKINFKYPQTFLKFQTEAIKILKTDFSLFNNDFVDEAIYRIITEENDFDYHQELDRCIDRLNELITALDFEDDYERARELKNTKEIDTLIGELKEDIFRLDLKHQNLRIFTDNHRSLYKKQSEALIGFLELRKEQLSENKTGEINPVIDISKCIALHEAFADIIWKSGISQEDFLRYWTIGSMPLKFNDKLINKNYFVFLLYELGLLENKSVSGFTLKEIANLFGISNISKTKSNVIKRHESSNYYHSIREKLASIPSFRKK